MPEGGCTWGAVIVAAGSGSRFGTSVPKQFLGLEGMTPADRSIRAFGSVEGISAIVVVTPRGDGWRSWWTPPGGVLTVPGGARRQDSVLAGLRELESCTHVLVHDAARPLVSRELIERVMQAAVEFGAAVPAVPVRDTVKTVSDSLEVTGTVSRSGLRLSQTPQGFLRKHLVKALEGAGDVTDECAAMEAAGWRVMAVEGDPANIKLTGPGDADMVVSMLRAWRETRTGTGIDFHPFEEGVPLVLGGCGIESGSGLAGHSDGDAVLHAVADALLSAARMGDIGVHFPPGEPRWKDADSAVLLGTVAEMVRAGGWEIEQVDVTVISDFPRIAPLRGDMIGRIAEILGVEEAVLWVKGTTANSLGDIGRGRGLACLATVSLTRPAER